MPFFTLASYGAAAVFGLLSWERSNTSQARQERARKQAGYAAAEQARRDRAESTVAEARLEAESRQARSKELRKSRILKAQLIASAENTGAGGSSGVAGTIGQIGTDVGANISFLDAGTAAARSSYANRMSTNQTIFNWNMAASKSQGKAGKASTQANLWSSASSFASTWASLSKQPVTAEKDV